jgi:DNA-3-methyladenine glycosylase
MFGPPGHAYVYFTYGMHFCVNMVCLGEEGPTFGHGASAVLLRAGAIIAGEDLARARRTRGPVPEGRAPIAPRDLARGPARLCQALGIDRSQDGADVVSAGSPLRMLSGAGNPARSGRILTGPRVGVSSAAEIPWRYWYDGDPTVSVYRAHVPRQPKLVTP